MDSGEERNPVLARHLNVAHNGLILHVFKHAVGIFGIAGHVHFVTDPFQVVRHHAAHIQFVINDQNLWVKRGLIRFFHVNYPLAVSLYS